MIVNVAVTDCRGVHRHGARTLCPVQAPVQPAKVELAGRRGQRDRPVLGVAAVDAAADAGRVLVTVPCPCPLRTAESA